MVIEMLKCKLTTLRKSSHWQRWLLFGFLLLTAGFAIKQRLKSQENPKINDRRSKGVIHLSFLSTPRRLDPTTLLYSHDFLFIQPIFDTLTRLDDNGRAVASLAKRWTVDGAGTLFTFELHPGARFHHGNPIESRDVANSLARHFWPGSKSGVKSYLENILVGAKEVKKGELPSGLTILGPHSISFRLVGPYAPFLSVLAMPGFGIYPKDWDFSKDPNGSGPMKARYIKESQCWHLERYEDYLGPKPRTKTFRISAVPSLADNLKGIQTGELDLALGFNYSSMDPERMPSEVEILKTNSAIIRHLYLNPDHPLLKDKAFRQDLAALIHGVTKEPVFQSPFMTLGSHIMPKGILPDRYYDRKILPMTPSYFKQKWGKTAKAHELRFTLNKGTFHPARLERLYNTFTAAGLQFKLDPKTIKGIIETQQKHDFDIIGLGYVGNFSDPDGFLEILQEGSTFKKPFLPSRELLQKLAQARFIQDPGERLNAYTEALLHFENQYYVIPLFHMNAPILHRKDIHLPDNRYRDESELTKIYWKNSLQ